MSISEKSKYQRLTGVIAFSRIFVDVAGSAIAGLFLSQADYWSQNSPNGWFQKSIQDWKTKTGITRYEQDKIKGHLSQLGILEIRQEGNPSTLMFRVNYERLDAAIDKILKNDWKSSRPKNKYARQPKKFFADDVDPQQRGYVDPQQGDHVDPQQGGYVDLQQGGLVDLQQTDYIYKIINKKDIYNPSKDACAKKVEEIQEGGESSDFFDLIDWDKLQSQQVDWEQQQDTTISENKVFENFSNYQVIQGFEKDNAIAIEDLVLEINATNVETNAENRSVVNKSFLQGEHSAATATSAFKIELEATISSPAIERYTQVNSPALERNLDGSPKFPWEIPGERRKFNPDFESWMCQRLGTTTFYKKLSAGQALVQVRKHIAMAKTDNQRADGLFIEWDAMIADVNRPVAIGDMPANVAMMTVEEIQRKQKDEEQITRIRVKEEYKKCRSRWFKENNLAKIPLAKVYELAPDCDERIFEFAWKVIEPMFPNLGFDRFSALVA